MAHRPLPYATLQTVLRRLPTALQAILRKHGATCFLAGGALRDYANLATPRDFDLFIASHVDADGLAGEVASAIGASHSDIRLTDRAHTVRRGELVVQVIHRWRFNDAASVISAFDFTACQAAVWHDGADWQSLSHCAFEEDARHRRLRYTGPHRDALAGGTLLRVCRFLRRGYSISAHDLARVVSTVAAEAEEQHPGLTPAEAVLETLMDAYPRHLEPEPAAAAASTSTDDEDFWDF